MSETETGVRCYILPLRNRQRPCETDSASMALAWSDATVAERLARGLEVAPGVRIVILSIGDHWQPVLAESVYGALVAVRTG